jgi:hypothetical protein
VIIPLCGVPGLLLSNEKAELDPGLRLVLGETQGTITRDNSGGQLNPH